MTTDASLVQGKTFDYIVAGGGLTGLTVASRLSENPNITVLVVEGAFDNHEDPMVKDLRAYGQAFETYLDYNLTSTPVVWQNNTPLLMVAGHTLGGSDSINGASFTKGDSSQYDLLPSLNGDASWAWEPFNNFMKMAENFHVPDEALMEKGAEWQVEYHGKGGPIQVSFSQNMYGYINLPALEAAEEVWPRLEKEPDVADGSANGGTIIPNMCYPDAEANRSSAVTGYTLDQVASRSNFNILLGHRVIEILWEDDSATTAAGVRFQASPDAEVQEVYTNREVIVACGSMQSPQLLELSGVGDPDVLESVGITTKRALSGVGKHLQEQTKNSLYFTPNTTDFDGSGPSTSIAYPNAHQVLGDNATAVYKWVSESLPDYAQQCYDQGDVADVNATIMILQAQVDDLFMNKSPAVEIFFTLSDSLELVGTDLWNLIVMARGSIHTTTNSSWDKVTIEPRYFGHPLDLLFQSLAVEQARQAFNTPPLSGFVLNETFPGQDFLAADAAREDWDEFVRQSFTSVWHPIATLAMMKEEYGGVVDSRFKVYGINNVRAVDASVLPIQLSAHLSSSLFGIAEKAAETIKEDVAAGNTTIRGANSTAPAYRFRY
ncbi:GMC oxidoreductase [Polychaeton citri CBS 116435]|uniref:GMC oxidoreductase n=1 Tax=Polychaeton citri CBS 116435 TaxID=1314669 RepID=A0A9P4Q220_9PEZI|nr:GMC oxidoreductase [Polychaeton citri CBS 116435]